MVGGLYSVAACHASEGVYGEGGPGGGGGYGEGGGVRGERGVYGGAVQCSRLSCL